MEKILPIKLSIVISCFNEAQRLPRYIDEAYQFLEQNIESFELIMVNDGSTDQTAELLKEYENQYPKVKVVSYDQNHGKGYGIKKGVEKADGEVIAYMDADFAIDLDHIPQFLQIISSDKADLVIGARNLKTSLLQGEKSWVRRFFGNSLSLINDFMLNLPGIEDTQCGFKFFKAQVAKKLFANLTTYRWLFDMEILSKACQNHFRILALPVKWQEIPGSKVNIARDLVPVALDLLKIYLRFALLKILFIISLLPIALYLIITI